MWVGRKKNTERKPIHTNVDQLNCFRIYAIVRIGWLCAWDCCFNQIHICFCAVCISAHNHMQLTAITTPIQNKIQAYDNDNSLYYGKCNVYRMAISTDIKELRKIKRKGLIWTIEYFPQTNNNMETSKLLQLQSIVTQYENELNEKREREKWRYEMTDERNRFNKKEKNNTQADADHIHCKILCIAEKYNKHRAIIIFTQM